MKIFGVAVGIAGVILAGSAGATTSSVLPGSVLFSSYQTNALDANTIPLGFPTSLVPGSPDAQEFTTATAATLSSLTVRLSDANPTDGGSILVYLVPNNITPSLNIPSASGLQLTGTLALGTISDSSLSTTASNVTIPIYASLSAGTYWLALVNGADTLNGGTNSVSTGAQWYRVGDMIGVDLGNNVSNTDAGLYNVHVAPSGTSLKSATNGAFAMQIDTPEPTSLALCGAGLTGLGLLKGRRRKHRVG